MMCKEGSCGSMCGVHKVAAILLVIGGLNWGLVAINPSWNVVEMIAGMGMAARVIYGLVGLSAIGMLCAAKCCMKGCGMGSCKGGSCKGEGSCKGGASCSGQASK